MIEELKEEEPAPKKKQVRRSNAGRRRVVIPDKFTKTGRPVKKYAPLPKHMKRKPGPRKKSVQKSPKTFIEMPDGTKTTPRGAAIKERKERIIRELFENREYELVREIKLDPGQYMHTVIRNKVRHVFILREISNPANVVVLGKINYRKVAAKYGSYKIERRSKRPE